MHIGAVHAVAPGHGKTLMAFYLSARGELALHAALTVGATVTTTHTAGVLLLGVLVAAGTTLSPAALYPWFTIASGVIVVAIGGALLRSVLRARPPQPMHMLGQVTGRTGAAVVGWLDERGQAWKDAVEVVAIDPAVPYRNAVRKALPHATIVVDHFHLVALANKTVTKVRQRVTREQLGRRGRKTDPAWANRRLLLRGWERLSERAFARMWNGCVDNDPTSHLLAAWIAKEELRALLACAARGSQRHDISHRLHAFYTWCAAVHVPEVTALAETVQAWWPEILAFLTLGVTNAGTEGTNRLIKQVKRHACGFRNEDHFRDRVRLHSTRNRDRMSARTVRLPTQS
jgi:transposase